MATAIAKFFKKKHNKENDEPPLIRGKLESSSMRCKLIDKVSSNDSFGACNGELEIRQQSSDKIFNEVSSNDQWKYRSPYWKVTDPKTKNSSRSVPGVPTYGALSSRLKREPRHFSPPLKSESLFKHPTILEVSGSYENYPSNSSQNESTQDENINSNEKRFKKFNFHERSSTLRQSIGRATSTNQTNIRQNHKTDLRNRNSHHLLKHDRKNLNKFNQQNTTSEYGSADPSPTNHFPAASVHSNRMPSDFFMDENSFENTDYESDSDDPMPTNLVHLCEQQLRWVNARCKAYKDKAKRYKNNCNLLHSQLEEVQAELTKEKNKQKTLNAELFNSKMQIMRLREFIDSQFNNNSYIQKQPNTQFKFSQQKQEIFSQRQMNNKKIEKNLPFFGAGEAMCSTTELALGNENNEPNNFLKESLIEKKKFLDLNSAKMVFSESTRPSVLSNKIDDFDELKTFRQLDSENEDDKEGSSFMLEQPRDFSCIENLSSNNLSPVIKSKNEVIIEDALNSSLNGTHNNKDLKEDDGYSTMQQQNQNCRTSLCNKQYSVFHQNDFQKGKISVLSPKNTTIKRSLSDTVIMSYIKIENCIDNKLICDLEPSNVNFNNKLNFDVKEIQYEPSTIETSKINKKVVFKNNDDLVKEERTSIKRRNRYCAYNPKNRTDCSSSYSSDDEAVRLMSKQLRQKGELVHFRPPRKSLVNCERNLFRQFGSRERQAIAQFDYLRDMPTDVSGLLSSPGSQSN